MPERSVGEYYLDNSWRYADPSTGCVDNSLFSVESDSEAAKIKCTL